MSSIDPPMPCPAAAHLEMQMKTRSQRERHHRDLHFLTEEGVVACNPRDREAAHRAEVEGIATEDPQAVTCKECRDVIRTMRGRRHPED